MTEADPRLDGFEVRYDMEPSIDEPYNNFTPSERLARRFTDLAAAERENPVALPANIDERERAAFLDVPVPGADATFQDLDAYRVAARTAGYDVSAKQLERSIDDLQSYPTPQLVNAYLDGHVDGDANVMLRGHVVQQTAALERERFARQASHDLREAMHPERLSALAPERVGADPTRFATAMTEIGELPPPARRGGFAEYEAYRDAFREVGVRLTADDFLAYRDGDARATSLGNKMLEDLDRSPNTRQIVGKDATAFTTLLRTEQPLERELERTVARRDANVERARIEARSQRVDAPSPRGVPGARDARSAEEFRSNAETGVPIYTNAPSDPIYANAPTEPRYDPIPKDSLRSNAYDPIPPRSASPSLDRTSNATRDEYDAIPATNETPARSATVNARETAYDAIPPNPDAPSQNPIPQNTYLRPGDPEPEDELDLGARDAIASGTAIKPGDRIARRFADLHAAERENAIPVANVDAARRNAFFRVPPPRSGANFEQLEQYRRDAREAGFDISADEIQTFVSDLEEYHEASIIGRALDGQPSDRNVMSAALMAQNGTLTDQIAFNRRAGMDRRDETIPGFMEDLTPERVRANPAQFRADMAALAKAQPLMPNASYNEFSAYSDGFRAVGVRLTENDFNAYRNLIRDNRGERGGLAALQRSSTTQDQSLGVRMLADLHRSPELREFVGSTPEAFAETLDRLQPVPAELRWQPRVVPEAIESPVIVSPAIASPAIESRAIEADAPEAEIANDPRTLPASSEALEMRAKQERELIDAVEQMESENPVPLAHVDERTKAAFLDVRPPRPFATAEVLDTYRQAARNNGYDVTSGDLVAYRREVETFVRESDLGQHESPIFNARPSDVTADRNVMLRALERENPTAAQALLFNRERGADALEAALPGNLEEALDPAKITRAPDFKNAMKRIEGLPPVANPSHAEFTKYRDAFREVGARLTVEDFDAYREVLAKGGPSAMQSRRTVEAQSLSVKMLADLHRSPEFRDHVGARPDAFRKDLQTLQPPSGEHERVEALRAARIERENSHAKDAPSVARAQPGLHVTRGDVTIAMPENYRQSGRVVSVTDAVTTQNIGMRNTVEYPTSELTTAIDRRELDRAAERGDDLRISNNRGSLEIENLSLEREQTPALTLDR